MELHTAPELYSRVIHFDEEKLIQVRLTINTFRGVEYLHLRKYYMDFDENWSPSNEGIAMPISFDNTRELFSGLVEILSLAESKEILESQFREQLDLIYVR